MDLQQVWTSNLNIHTHKQLSYPFVQLPAFVSLCSHFFPYVYLPKFLYHPPSEPSVSLPSASLLAQHSHTNWCCILAHISLYVYVTLSMWHLTFSHSFPKGQLIIFQPCTVPPLLPPYVILTVSWDRICLSAVSVSVLSFILFVCLYFFAKNSQKIYLKCRHSCHLGNRF